MFSHKPINQVVLLTLERGKKNMVEGDGFEPSKAVPADLQSAPFGHSGTPPGCVLLFTK
ncbi:hypothetical protein MED222_20204 [Vibrio sp. MED222]|nr:hypothetical protein MED222_20204 [Vibrio sp. MED222]